MEDIKNHPNVTLQILVTGAHLSENFGFTIKEIIKDGFKVDSEVPISTLDDSEIGIVSAMSEALLGSSRALNELAPDLIVILGDRFEIFAVAAAALVMKIPIAHLYGGELTIGAYDDAFRHSITKMSHLHFVATEQYRDRVIQLGENPSHIFNVGGLGIDNIHKFNLLSRKQIEDQLGFRFQPKSFLITFHPATLESERQDSHFNELLRALGGLTDTTFIFTMPNADSGSRAIQQMIHKFTSQNPNAFSFNSLGQLMYLSCMAQVDGIIGNSSSGLTEAPSLQKGTINIGNRQLGRMQSSSVINCSAQKKEILNAINRLYSNEFKSELINSSNPYGTGGASKKIVEKLTDFNLNGLVQKQFFDL